MSSVNVTKANRIFYVADNGELFVQFRPDKKKELSDVAAHVDAGETVYYREELNSCHSISGYVTRITKSGIALRGWSIQ